MKIVVGGGTCGIAAGASKIFKRFKDQSQDMEILLFGCKGICHLEVLVEVIDHQ